MSDLRLNQTSSYSALPKLDPDIKRVMDNVNKDTQRLANEAPEKSPQPILDSLKNGRCKNTLAGRFRALAAGLFTAKGSHNVGFEITTASLVGRKGEPGSSRQLKIKLSSLTQKGRDQELANATTAVGICNKARLSPEQITTRDLEILENIEKSLPKDSELFGTIQTIKQEITSDIRDKARLNPEQISTRDLEILENIAKSLPKDSELFNTIQTIKQEIVSDIQDKTRSNPEQITTRELEILEYTEKSLPKDSELFQEVQSAAIEVLYHMVNNGEISDNLKNSIRTHCQERCDYLNASDKNTNTVSMDDILKLGFLYTSVNGESTNAEKSEPGTPVDVLAHAFLRIHSLDLSNLMNHLNIRDNDIFKDHDGVHRLRNLQNAIQPYLTNPQTADDVLQLESNYKLLKPFLPKDSTLQDVQKQAAQSYFDHTWQGLCDGLSTSVALTDTQKLEEAHSILQKYAPDISISEDMKTALSSAIQIARQNVQKTEQELETASAAYAALPAENFYYDDLNAIAVYDSTRDGLKMDFNFEVQHFSTEGPSASLSRLYDGLNASDLKEIAGSLNEHKKALQGTLSNLQEALQREGGVVPKDLKIAIEFTTKTLESLEKAFQSEISSLSENSNTISKELKEALQQTENAYQKLGEIAGPAIDEAFRKCDEAHEAEKAQQIEEEAKAKAEAQLQRDLVISNYDSAIAEDSFNNRAGLEIVCLRLGKFLPSDDPAFDEVEKLVPGFKDKLNAPQEDLIPSDLSSPDSEKITNLGDLPPPPVLSEENLAFARALDALDAASALGVDPESEQAKKAKQAMADWEAKYVNMDNLDLGDLPPPPGDFSGLGDLPPPPGNTTAAPQESVPTDNEHSIETEAICSRITNNPNPSSDDLDILMRAYSHEDNSDEDKMIEQTVADNFRKIHDKCEKGFLKHFLFAASEHYANSLSVDNISGMAATYTSLEPSSSQAKKLESQLNCALLGINNKLGSNFANITPEDTKKLQTILNALPPETIIRTSHNKMSARLQALQTLQNEHSTVGELKAALEGLKKQGRVSSFLGKALMKRIKSMPTAPQTPDSDTTLTQN